MSGLKGVTINTPFTLEQIEDDIMDERMKIIKEYALKNAIPTKDLLYSIRCIEVDCEKLDRCPCGTNGGDTLKHIELPQLWSEFGEDSIDYIGSADGLIDYAVYTNHAYKTHKFKRRGAEKPYVWIDTTPNENNMLDAFIFNANPLLTKLLVRVIPKDIRQLYNYECCTGELNNITFLDADIKSRLTEKYLRYYRQGSMPITPNDQTVKA